MRALLLVVVLVATAAAAPLVSVRPVAVVDDPVLRLGDLFEGAGERADTAIGAAPAPGRRLVLEPPVLFGLARAHGLDWRPLSVQDRVVVERPGRAVSREDVAAAIAAALENHGLDPEFELDLGPFAPPMVPPGVAVELAVEGAAYDPATRRFQATLVVAAAGMPGQRQRIAGRALPTVAVMVATRRLALGDVVGAGDMRPARLRAERVRAGTAEGAAQVVGQQLRRPVAAGAAFQLADLGPPAMVAKNALVTLLLEAPGMALAAQGRALEAAPRGATVTVMNLASRQVIEGVVVAPGQVRVAFAARR